ncbi:MAG: T9SS type A sorting domain-containing protein, partial [Candidatus Symbiothrix sp.]|nr:T9SS type A sorting domain-containing protein [Candidatus Symbiothrix sp.]
QLNLLIHEWDVPSVNLLGAIDNGSGQWASGYVADNAHPNTAGHAEMFYVIVPSLLDALAAEKPQPQRVENTSLVLTKGETTQRIALTPENVLHSFTLTFGFKTTDTGTLASFVTATGDSAFIKINAQGKLAYETYSTTATKTSTGTVNDGQWHNASLTYYYAWGKTILYLDGTQVNLTPLSEKHVPTGFHINDFGDAPQSAAYREVFLHRAGMSKEEIQALHQGKMLKSSLEIYAPLDAEASDKLYNAAQSLNTLEWEERQTTAINKPRTGGMLPEVKYVYSLTGRQIACFPASDNTSLSSLPKGVYILKQTGGTHTSYKKIVLFTNN